MTKTENTGLRAAVYARVSTEEQKEGQTVDSQVAELEEFAAANGWTVADAYKDDGWSGSIMARPALDQLRDDARLGRFDAVLINDVDRLARDVAHLGVIKRDLERHNVRVIFRKLPSALGRNDPTLLSRNCRHHAEAVVVLPAGKSGFLPQGKCCARQGSRSPVFGRLACSGRLVQETERLTRGVGADDGKPPRTPAAWMMMLVHCLPHAETCSKSCSWCGSV